MIVQVLSRGSGAIIHSEPLEHVLRPLFVHPCIRLPIDTTCADARIGGELQIKPLHSRRLHPESDVAALVQMEGEQVPLKLRAPAPRLLLLQPNNIHTLPAWMHT
jgi:hypothetical protein